MHNSRLYITVVFTILYEPSTSQTFPRSARTMFKKSSQLSMFHRLTQLRRVSNALAIGPFVRHVHPSRHLPTPQVTLYSFAGDCAPDDVWKIQLIEHVSSSHRAPTSFKRIGNWSFCPKCSSVSALTYASSDSPLNHFPQKAMRDMQGLYSRSGGFVFFHRLLSTTFTSRVVAAMLAGESESTFYTARYSKSINSYITMET